MFVTMVKFTVAALLGRLLFSCPQVGQDAAAISVTWAGGTWGSLLLFLVCALPLAVVLGFILSGRSDDGSDAEGDGKLVLISGCDFGIGNLAAKTLHKKGYKVVAGCLTVNGVEDLRRECPGVIAMKCDVTKEQDVMDIATKVSSLNGGKLHAVVNNAGIVKGTEVLVQDISGYESTINVNLLGSIRLTKVTLHMLIDTPGSRVVFMSSVAGLVHMPFLSSYSASKFGIEGFAGVLRVEMEAFDVQVSILNPSTMSTPMLDTFSEDYTECHAAAPPEVKKIYGEEYVRKVAESRRPKYRRWSMDNPEVAVMDICRAVGSKRPKIRYYSGKASKRIFRLGYICPAFMRSFNRQGVRDNPPTNSKNIEMGH